LQFRRNSAQFALRTLQMKRAVETTEDFKARIATIIGDKPEKITGARRPHSLLVRKKRVTVRKRRHR
jgi:hypothetical protein